jgi:hypothetical protein
MLYQRYGLRPSRIDEHPKLTPLPGTLPMPVPASPKPALPGALGLACQGHVTGLSNIPERLNTCSLTCPRLQFGHEPALWINGDAGG